MEKSFTLISSTATWQSELSSVITDANALIEALELPSSLLPAARRAAQLFPLRVTPTFLQQIEKGNPCDPLLRQILPLEDELEENDWIKDPLQEQSFLKQKGLIQKYAGRVLVIASTHCAINCRYCFRRNFAYEDNRLSTADWADILAEIATDTSITEVILSGGDPMGLSDKRLFWLLDELEKIAHVSTLRIHTRYTVVLPSRFTEVLCKRLKNFAKRTVLVSHINHANEISESSKTALRHLKLAGVTLLNQSVLLKGVNNDFAALKKLSKALFAADILPYYLHMPDEVLGTKHFDVSLADALNLIETLRQSLPGYLVPRLVREVPGEHSKTPQYK